MKTLSTTVNTGVVVLGLLLSLAFGQQEQPPDASAKTNALANQQELGHGLSPALSDPGQIVPGRFIQKVDAQYPKEAERNKTQGTVILQATIDKNGIVSNIAIISGELILADAAVDAVRNCKFEPYTQSGQSIEVQQQFTFHFSLGAKSAEFDAQLPPLTLASKSLALPKREAEDRTLMVGHGVIAPKAIYAPDPEYSEIAKKMNYQGMCVLSLIIGADGVPRDLKVIRAAGLGMDVKAVQSVSTWRFQPGTKDGKPVATYATIQVVFHRY